MSKPWGRLNGIRPAKIARLMLKEYNNIKETETAFKAKYGTDDYRGSLAVNVGAKEQKFIDSKYKDGISLYVGIPFCPSRCAYCSFISFSVEKSGQLLEPYLMCLEKEIKASAALMKNTGKRIETVYIGGGTPTTLSAEQLRILINSLYTNFDLSYIKEFTVEAGRPDTVSYEKMSVLKNSGVTRISINPQSMNEQILKNIGRKHTPEQIISAFEDARKAGINNINTDIIAGLPGETAEMFSDSLNKIISLSPEAVTVHTMSLKRASVINQNISGYKITDGEEVSKMIDYASEALARKYYFPYYLYRQKNILGGFENTGYSKLGFECLYNIYIMEEVQSILALGAGASSKVITKDDIERVFNVKEPTEYINRIDEMTERKKEFFSLL